MARERRVASCLVAGLSALIFACSNPTGTGSPRELKETKDNKAEARLILARALEAHGGKELVRLHIARVVYRVGGRFLLLGKAPDLDVTITEQVSIPGHMRKDITGKANGQPYSLTWIAGPDGVWSRQGDRKPVVSSEPADIYSQFRAYLALETLRDLNPEEWLFREDFSDANLAAVQNEGAKGNTYYFDRKTHLLAKTASIELPQAATYFDDYRKIAGLPLYHRITARHHDRQVFQITIDSVQLLDKIDAKEFTLPKP